ncbi:MAG: DUF1836 domain-containing protein [Oscillospiraceae bacterium]
MDIFITSNLAEKMANFHMPRYNEFPNISLYLDQVITYLDDLLVPLLSENDEPLITASMVNNYVKQGVLPRPLKKKYNSEHLAYLTFILFCKQVMSISEIQQLISVQKSTYPIEIAYNYFCTELENILKSIFTGTDLPEDTAILETQETQVIRVSVAIIARKIYLNKYLEFIDNFDNKN